MTKAPIERLSGDRVARWLAWLVLASWWVTGAFLLVGSRGDEAAWISVGPWTAAPIGIAAVYFAVKSTRTVLNTAKERTTSSWILLGALAASASYVGFFVSFLTTPLDQSSSAYLAIIPALLGVPFFIITGLTVVVSAAKVLRERRLPAS